MKESCQEVNRKGEENEFSKRVFRLVERTVRQAGYTGINPSRADGSDRRAVWKITPGNRQSVFSDVVDRLRDQGIDVKQHHRLIAQILDQEIEVEIAKK